MSCYKRGGIWWCEFEIRGERYRRSTEVESDRSKREAEKAERALRTFIEAGAKRRAARAYTLSEACAIWLRERGALLTEARKEQEASLLRTAALFDDDPLVADIDAAMVAGALGRRRAMTYGKKIAKRVSESRVIRDTIAPLRRVLNYLEEIHGAEVQHFKWGKLTTGQPKGRGRTLRDDQQDLFWEAIRPDYRDFVEFAMLAIQRRSQCLAGWDAWDVNTRTLQVKRLKKKPGAAAEYRTLHMGTRATELIEAQRGRHPTMIWTYEVQGYVIDPDSGLKIRASTGERRPITAEGLKSQWRRKARRMAAPGFRVHDLRHHGATALVRETGSLELARDRLDHSSITVTSDFYAHVLDDDARSAAASVEAGVGTRPADRYSESPHKNPHSATRRKGKSG